MCGRYTLRTPLHQILRHFGISDEERQRELFPRYNIAPTQMAPVVRSDEAGRRQLAMLHWGLVPSWAEDLKIGNRLINARAETVAAKPAFRSAFKRRRCLVPVDGFYEWQKRDATTKQPYHIRRKDGGLLALAGLWERWEKGDEPVETFTIITTDANDDVRSLHGRMPVILKEQDYGLWLDEAFQGYDHLQRLLAPCDADRLASVPVSKAVNNPRNDSPECLAELPR